MLSSKSYKYDLTDNSISIDTVSVSNLNTLQGEGIPEMQNIVHTIIKEINSYIIKDEK